MMRVHWGDFFFLKGGRRIMLALNKKMIGKLVLGFLVLAVLYVLFQADPASAAFKHVDLGGSKVGSKSTTAGLFKDINFILVTVLGIAGAIVIACIIFAGVKLATAQGNPQNRTQGFIGLGMAFIGGWVVYKCLEIAGWIKGFGG